MPWTSRHREILFLGEAEVAGQDPRSDSRDGRETGSLGLQLSLQAPGVFGLFCCLGLASLSDGLTFALTQYSCKASGLPDFISAYPSHLTAWNGLGSALSLPPPTPKPAGNTQLTPGEM